MPFVNTIEKAKPSVLRIALRSVTAGALVFALLVLVDQVSAHLGLTGVQRLGDNLLGGIIVGVISFVDEQRRQRSLAGQLNVIALMNHHVRNALQTIKYAHGTEKEVEFINDSVVRIEWALREILPGGIEGR